MESKSKSSGLTDWSDARRNSIPTDRGIRVCAQGLDAAVFRDGDTVYVSIAALTKALP